MRFDRWTNSSQPQTLQIGVILLYIVGFSGLLGLLGILNTSTPYVLLFLKVDVRIHGAAYFVEAVACATYVISGLLIANDQRRGWISGIAVAAGGVVIPVATVGFGAMVSSHYVISWLFDVALFALLVHPQSRSHQKIWFR